MWRKPNDAKPSSQPSSKVPEAPAPVKPQAAAPAPAVSSAPAAPATVQATPAPAPAITPAAAPQEPIYSAPPVKTVVAHDTPAASSLGSGLKIRGELSGSSDLYIDGDAQGKITLADSRVTIGPNGRVQADIEAREIVIEGTVEGNLKARESVRLASSSKVQGSVMTPRIGIDDGAKLRGKVEMIRTGEPVAPANPAGVSAKPAAAGVAYKAAAVASESEQSKR